MSRTLGVVMAGATLASCGPSYSKLKVDELQSVMVATTDATRPVFCAYGPVALRALVTYRNGERAGTPTPGEEQQGRLRTSEFQWSSSHGTVDDNAVLALPDPMAWFDEPIRVSARVSARPEIAGETIIQPRFDCGGTLDYRGREGARGGEAEDGGRGAPGPVLEVALAYIDTKRNGRLVLVRARRDTDEPEYFVIDARPPEKPFVVDARGGAGGRGGQGIAGADARPGRDAVCHGGPGQPGTDGEAGGPGAPGHNGGSGGDGGRVSVRYDARFPELRSRLQVLVDGGEAGVAGTGGTGGRGGRRGHGCTGPDGSRAPDAADGAHGATGSPGVPGRPGRPGVVQESAATVGELFAPELARSLPIVTGATEGP